MKQIIPFEIESHECRQRVALSWTGTHRMRRRRTGNPNSIRRDAAEVWNSTSNNINNHNYIPRRRSSKAGAGRFSHMDESQARARVAHNSVNGTLLACVGQVQAAHRIYFDA